MLTKPQFTIHFLLISLRADILKKCNEMFLKRVWEVKYFKAYVLGESIYVLGAIM